MILVELHLIFVSVLKRYRLASKKILTYICCLFLFITSKSDLKFFSLLNQIVVKSKACRIKRYKMSSSRCVKKRLSATLSDSVSHSDGDGDNGWKYWPDCWKMDRIILSKLYTFDHLSSWRSFRTLLVLKCLKRKLSNFPLFLMSGYQMNRLLRLRKSVT